MYTDTNDMTEYESVIGLEIHVELKTNSKMFCGCKNDPFFAKQPNSYTCPVCLGLPGALPVPNRRAVEWTVLLGLALGCDIPKLSKFDRKNYFYPDLPKGYQISQYDQPLAVNGRLDIKYQKKSNIKNQISKRSIRIRRVHLEEDTAKLLHTTVGDKKVTLIDFNRSGVPLVEIVTEPDLRSAEEAKAFLKKLHQIIRYLDISDADMEKGSMRIEPNISVRKRVRPLGSSRSDPELLNDVSDIPSYKVEVKNINSFRFAERAIEFEIQRHSRLLEKGETPEQETRGWNEGKGETYSQRRKEEADDYRYFPEPDIPPMRWSASQISELRTQIPKKMPDDMKEEFMKKYGLDERSAELLTETIEIADRFIKCLSVSEKSYKKASISPVILAKWLINRKQELEGKTEPQIIHHIASSLAIQPVSDVELIQVIETIFKENPKAVEDYKGGKVQVLMYLVGQIKKKYPHGDAAMIRKLLERRLQ